MRITILNGEPDMSAPFDGYVRACRDQLEKAGHDVTLLDLRGMELKGCSGCWGCWVKTPGECVKSDESATICRSVITSDLTVLAAPVTMGFTSSLLKRAADQMIALVHPYLVIEGGELHHRPRYDRYPEFGLLLSAGSDTDPEDIEITATMWSRMARNMKSRLTFTAIADRSAEEVAHELVAAA
jgi:multimeric flavodoxin WrbA